MAIKHALLDQGVSHIGIPNDVQKLPYEAQILPFEGRMPNLAYGQEEWLIEKAAKVVDQAVRPVILAGFGAQRPRQQAVKVGIEDFCADYGNFQGKRRC